MSLRSHQSHPSHSTTVGNFKRISNDGRVLFLCAFLHVVERWAVFSVHPQPRVPGGSPRLHHPHASYIQSLFEIQVPVKRSSPTFFCARRLSLVPSNLKLEIQDKHSKFREKSPKWGIQICARKVNRTTCAHQHSSRPREKCSPDKCIAQSTKCNSVPSRAPATAVRGFDSTQCCSQTYFNHHCIPQYSMILPRKTSSKSSELHRH